MSGGGINHRAVLERAVTQTTAPRVATPRLRIGPVWVDVLTFGGALRAIEALVERREGGAVFTPNVDHVVKASRNEPFRRAYDRVSLSLADGMPLIWASRILGCPLPERVAGSDLLQPLLQLAARKRWRVYLLGGAPGVAEQSARLLTEEMGIIVAGWDDCRISSDGSDPGGASIERARAARADLVFVALGPPKQELWIDLARERIAPAVALGVGASFDFLVGKYKRAPRWMGAYGLEWLYRLSQEPRRLWRRYLVEGPRFIGIVASTSRSPRSARIVEGHAASPVFRGEL
jgi:N-acetylglucosaminyldiphosphoundecaprenol N-acetyl-beta-D-mannosaminyltransferase